MSTRGWLTGVDWVVWATAAVSAGGGLLIALILRIAGSIAKTYAQCLAIVFTALGSVLWSAISAHLIQSLGEERWTVTFLDVSRADLTDSFTLLAVVLDN